MNKPTYKDSYGNRYTTQQINRRSDLAARIKIDDQAITYGYNFCEMCKRNDCKPIDVAHIVSRKEAKETGRTELCWDLQNLRVVGRKCHEKMDKLNLQFK